MFQGELFQEKMLGERVHDDCLLHAEIQMIYNIVKSLTVSINDSVRPTIGQG